MNAFFSQIYQQFINKRRVINRHPKLCLVSGGQDSTLLLILLLQLHYTKPTRFNVLYCHHFWQAQNFLAIWHLWQLAYLFHLPYTIVLTERPLESETSATIWRHESIQRIAALLGTKSVYKGHTLSDKLETAFLYLSRGTTSEGLFNSFSETPQTFAKQNYTERFSLLFLHEISFYSKNFDNLRTYVSRTSSYAAPQVLVSNNTMTREKPSRKRGGIVGNQNRKGNKTRAHWHKIKKESSFRVESPVQVSGLASYQTFLFCSRKTKATLFVFEHKSTGSGLSFYRPLTSCSRSQIYNSCYTGVLPCLADETNTHVTIIRNKIRYQIFPIIRYFLNKNFDTVFNSFLESNEIIQVHVQYELTTMLIEFISQGHFKKSFFLFSLYVKRYTLKFLYTRYSGRVLNSRHTHILDYLSSDK